MQVRFLGPLGVVTGSCAWMRDDSRGWSFLIDCGIQQGEPTQDIWNEANWPFDPKEIKFVILTHAHMDHSGLIPALYRKGFNGLVYCTKETRLLATELLCDAISHSALPYAKADIERIKWREPGPERPFGDYLPVDQDLFLQFFRTGHIVGAVSVVVSWGPKGDDQRSIHFSGDLGPGSENNETLPLLRFRMAPSLTTDYAVVESTYGDVVRNRLKHSADQRRLALRLLLDETLEQNGILVLPAFSIARTQDLMFDLHWIAAEANGKYDGLTFCLDSPLAARVNPTMVDAFARDEITCKGKVRPRWLGKQFFGCLGLDDKDPQDIAEGQSIIRMVLGTNRCSAFKAISRGNQTARNWRPIFSSSEEVKEMRKAHIHRPTVIVTSSGTCDGGRVVQWLSRLLRAENAIIALTGHCAVNTVGGKLLQLFNVPISERKRHSGVIALANQDLVKVTDIRANVRKIEGYSAHADQGDLLNWLVPKQRDGKHGLAARQVFVQHGEDRHRRALASALKSRVESKGLTVQAHLPDDPEQWWSLEEQSSAVDPNVERARIEQEIQTLQSRLRSMG